MVYEVREVMQVWPNAKMSGNNKILPTAYPVTLCWKPYKDQTTSEISFDSTAYERYADQLRSPSGSPTPDPAPPQGQWNLLRHRTSAGCLM